MKMKTQTKTTYRSMTYVRGALCEALNRVDEWFRVKHVSGTTQEGYEIGTLEKGIVESIDLALDMMPMTPAVLEVCEAQMVEILSFAPETLPDVLQIDAISNGGKIPLSTMN